MPSLTQMKHYGAVPCWHLQPFSQTALNSCREYEAFCAEALVCSQTQWSL